MGAFDPFAFREQQMRIAYPTQTQLQNGRLHGTCQAFPTVSADARARPRLRAAMREGLVDAVATCMKEHKDLPPPERAPLGELLEPPVLVAAKLALYQTMRDQNVSNVALAKRLRTVEGAVRRLLDPYHRSQIGNVEAALAKLGKRLLVELRGI